MRDLETENKRLRAWLQTIKDQAAEVRVIEMTELALSGNEAIEFPKTTPAFTAETVVNA